MSELDKHEIKRHQQWLGFLQPNGLVVTPAVLLQAQAILNNQVVELQEGLKSIAGITEENPDIEPIIKAGDLPRLFEEVLEWSKETIGGCPGGEPLPDSLEVYLKEYNEVLKPTYAIKEFEPEKGFGPWQLLVQVVESDQDLDTNLPKEKTHWQASPQIRMERLLRESKIPAGLLTNGRVFRLVYSPRGESTGHVTFPLAPMLETSGRPILAGFELLLGKPRLFTNEYDRRLPALLRKSRLFQNQVSETLSDQVLEALYELLRGFQGANELSQQELLKEVLAKDPQHIYSGLITCLLRLIFILFAEDRGLLSTEEVYVRNYSLINLFQRLQADNARYPDSMDQRYGAWAQLLTLFRLVYDGGRHGRFSLPARHGYLFDPERYPFLEGRRLGEPRKEIQTIRPPKISDGVVNRVLEKLMVLDGERLSYRSLDVEHIGSVYEKLMGFNLRVAQGRSLAVKVEHVPVAIDLDELLKTKPVDRAKWLKENSEISLNPKLQEELEKAKKVEAFEEILDKRIAREVTRSIVPPGTLLLQPTEERRKSGTHYTPRQLTNPIVEKALEPILGQMGQKPTPEQILGLKICDPAMGSGAFLVEACRQLAEHLVQAWHVEGTKIQIPPDEDELLYARRLIAQRCLYGVDRNLIAVDLAKLSLWLATLAKDHPFTFLDHNLRHGDSLVGLNIEQIRSFHWDSDEAMNPLVEPIIRERLGKVVDIRAKIENAGDSLSETELRRLLDQSEQLQDDLRLIGDLLVCSFFEGKERNSIRLEIGFKVNEWLKTNSKKEALQNWVKNKLEGIHVLVTFHWEVEFPEVFSKDRGGFDSFVGNPPFAGKNNIINNNRDGYLDWLKELNSDSHGNADLVSHFFRRVFDLLRKDGSFGLIATNTISQGDTRGTGLRWICKNGGSIFCAKRRVKWPGRAAVIVSVVWIIKGRNSNQNSLDEKRVERISAFLVEGFADDDPKMLKENEGKSYQGSIILGMGFTFSDFDKNGVATPIDKMKELIKKFPKNKERIFPFIGGEEINSTPRQESHRYVINFGDLSESEAKKWPDLYNIVKEKVKPEREVQKDKGGKEKWWLYLRQRNELYNAITGFKKVLVNAQVSTHLSFAFLPTGMVYSQKVNVFVFDDFATFALLQSRVHEVWARKFSSTLKDDLSYAITDCFETFPFPENHLKNHGLLEIGKRYYEKRSEIMVRFSQGLTTTYNQFHDPAELNEEIINLRKLHDEIDRVVFKAYGWEDVVPTCEFLLEYEDEQEEEGEIGRKKRRPWRYRWSEELRDKILGRLIDLNLKKIAEDKSMETSRTKKAKKFKDEGNQTLALFE